MVYSINLEDIYCGMALQGFCANSNISYGIQQLRDSLKSEGLLTPEVQESLDASWVDSAIRLGSLLYKTRMKQRTNDQDNNLPCGPNCGVYVPSESGDTQEAGEPQQSDDENNHMEASKSDGCMG